jgi:hypothetical protein
MKAFKSRFRSSTEAGTVEKRVKATAVGMHAEILLE